MMITRFMIFTCILTFAAGMRNTAGAQAADPAGNPSFNLVNRSGQAIIELYATPAGVDRWGRDRLERSFVPSGQRFPVRLPEGRCLYDVRVVYEDGRAEERRRVDACQVDRLAFPGRNGETGNGGQTENDPSFRLVNRSRSEVSEVYVSAVGSREWGMDRLGDDTVAAGSTRVIQMPSGTCSYDVRVVFGNGEATEKLRVNLCTITDLRVP